jgi:hypothetical protein
MIVFAPPTRHPFTPRKVVFLSGLSNPAACALSPTQRRFLDAVGVAEECKVYRNFPYLPGSDIDHPPPLWQASWNNFRQFLMAARGPYLAAARRHWEALAASTDELTVIAQSCGLEIANRCLAASGGPRVHLFSLGPVAWRAPPMSHTLIQGERDAISRLFFRAAHVVLPGVGHMNYLQHERVLHLINEHLCTSTSRS